MPRLARLDAPGVLHHVMGRGIEGREIFQNNTDRQDFVDRLKTLAIKGAFDIYAWTLMPNHFHLLVKTRNQPLSANMRKLLTGYVVNYNKRHRRYGHLFQNRYKSIVCQEDTYLKELVRYIHLNQLRSGLVKDFNELKQNPWSGHSAILGKVNRGWQDTQYVLSFFGTDGRCRRRYLDYVRKGISLGRRPELVGGGLIRSLGGWSEVLALRNRGEKQVFDQRILGDSEFVQEIQKDPDDLIKRNVRLSGQRIDLEALTEKVCKLYQASIIEVRSGSRRKPVIKARRVISWIGVRELGYTGAEVARYLGVTNSCVTRAVSSDIKPEMGNLLDSLSTSSTNVP